MRKGVRVTPGRPVDLGGRRPGATHGLADRDEAAAAVEAAAARMAEHATRLAADARRSLLVVLQGMDASGKDGTVRRCIGALNPMMVRITSFKAPTTQELAHDFLWRVTRELPGRGQVGVFNRSHYEDVLVVRVEGLAPEEVWRPRYEAINAWERNLVSEGTAIVKIFLHISREEQAERFLQRLRDPRKNWKFNVDDLAKRERWDDYMEAYEDALQRTSTSWAPWHVVPADHKWARDAIVTEILADTLEGMDLRYPPLAPEVRAARADLEARLAAGADAG
ncbi:MAG: PPK2 family polyphosphate kinase [Actinomycetota bacterium]